MRHVPRVVESVLRRMPRRAVPPGWLAIELGDRSVRLAHVRRDGQRPVVEFAERRSWDPAEPSSLDRIAHEFGVDRFRCTTLLRPAQYQILLVEAPAVERAELKAAMRWRIKDMLDYPVEEATVDLLELTYPANVAQRARQIYAVAARSETIRATLERFENAEIPLAIIDIPDTAQRNLMAFFETEKRGVAALTFDQDGGLITVTFEGELYLSRRLDITAQQLIDSVVEDRAAAQDRLLVESSESRARLFDRVLVEMQRSLDHCERTYPFFSLGRVLLSPLPENIGLREHLAANLYLPVETIDLAQVLRLPKAAEAWAPVELSGWLKLLGAGLRVE